jgi:hypothetical protein
MSFFRNRIGFAAAAALVAALGVGFGHLAVVVTDSSHAAESRSREDPTYTRHARGAIAPVATMEIVPAPVIDTRAAFFMGTGDGSNGSWNQR